MSNNKKYFYFFIITLTIFILDRISKLYILNIAENFGVVDIEISSFLNLILIWNTGIGFGLFSSEQVFFLQHINFNYCINKYYYSIFSLQI